MRGLEYLERVLGLDDYEQSFTPLLTWIDAARVILDAPLRAGDLPTTCSGEIVRASDDRNSAGGMRVLHSTNDDANDMG